MRTAWGTIARLVPDESIYLYFAVKNPDGEIPANYSTFVLPKGIVYKGGIARQGKPSDWVLLVFLGSFNLVSIILTLVGSRLNRRQQVRIEEQHVRVEEQRVQIDEIVAKQAILQRQIEERAPTPKG